jgi:replicative DNA helicase
MLTETLTIPHSREAEEALLGSVLINPDIFAETGLSAQAFYIHRHQFIWQAFQRLKDKARAIDSLTVCEELDDMGRLEEIGGPAFLTALLN